jgi:methionyl-tRNA synthetase
VNEPFYITTAIDYVNSKPHIGTAFEKIGADAVARLKRAQGFDVFFQIGADEHSTNVEQKAQESGKDPIAFCDEMVEAFKKAWDLLDISADRYIRTTQAEHIAAVRELFTRINNAGHIYQGTYTGWYCPSCEKYIKEEELVDGKCENHNSVPDWIEEENWFFKLTTFEGRLLRHIQDNPSFIEPEWRRNEIVSLIEGGLEDVSMTRNGVRWGIQPNEAPEQTIWVWFDALINYITGIGFPDDSVTFNRYWPADVHVIGKDITRFHCVVWPIMLMAADIPLPKQIFAHGFVYVEGQKMSKTLGNVVDPVELSERFGPDPVRYFLLREINFGKDGSFSWEKFRRRYNDDLANDLGNLLNRTIKMIHKFFDGTLGEPCAAIDGVDAELRTQLAGLYAEVAPLIETFGFHEANATLWDAVRRANTYIEETQPWKLNKSGDTARTQAVMYNIVESLRILAQLLVPIIPRTAEAIWSQLGLNAVGSLNEQRIQQAADWGWVPAGHTVGEPEVLFPKIEEEAQVEA